jgi:hypothetical protein
MRGLKPRKYKDHRRYSYPHTFGTVAGIPDFSVDPGLGRKDQNIIDPYFGNPPLPSGCTGFGTAGIAEADLKQRVDPKFTYDQTLKISGGQEGDECTLQDSFTSATVYGVRLKNETDAQALTHRRAPYFEVHPISGQDWFDALASAAYTGNRPVSIGTSWPQQFEIVGSDGIQTYRCTSWVGGHDHNIIGKKTISGVEYLVDDSWNGTDWGDSGLCYWSRDEINTLMSVSGSDALTNRPAVAGDIQLVRLTIWQTIISYLRQWLSLIK